MFPFPEMECVVVSHSRQNWRVVGLYGLIGVFLVGLSPLILAQSSVEVHGHVFHAEGEAPCGDALVQAWPCGDAFPVNFQGRFDATCSEGIDSLTVFAHGHEVVTVEVAGRSYIDVSLHSISVELAYAEVDARAQGDVLEIQVIERAGDLMSTLDRTPGIRSLDLGAGLIQPVLRGLMGSRVAVLEDGVPQVGGRWGADHGVLLDPDLYDGVEWVPGGGHIWLGPTAMGGALRLSAIRMLPDSGERTRAGIAGRWGDGRHKLHVLHQHRTAQGQWHVGVSASRFGDRNVPQTDFQYIGRSFALSDGYLPNTGGRALHTVAGCRRMSDRFGLVSLDLRASEVLQGLFPGIIGIPDQSDLLGDGQPYSVDLPQQHARRMQLAGKWMQYGVLDRTVRLAVSANQRMESAPPHAHGFGPEPDSDLSLLLNEFHVFAESRWQGIHGAFGVQAEWLEAETAGWEFLLPNHQRRRLSAMGEWNRGRHRLGLRLDAVQAAHQRHSEPLYAPDGSVVGDDIRALELNRVMPGWAVSWHFPLANGPKSSGTWTTTAYARAPSNYALGANGIHHGTFRFEQGNPDLNPEKTVEMRGALRSSPSDEQQKFQWDVQVFGAVHRGFIHLTPTPQFAPIAHAGQIYAFDALDALRTGGEFNMRLSIGAGFLSVSGAILGQWALETGLGLPFTPPADLRTEWTWPLSNATKVSIRHRALASANLTARNEASTPGASLWGLEFNIQGAYTKLTLEANNLFNVAWLDHASAYRALGLVAQGRWASVRFTVDVNHNDDRLEPRKIK